MTDVLLQFRSEFPILERTTYLVSNSLGAMPRAVPERLAEYVDQWAELGVRAWARGWWEMPVSVGDEIAPLIGAGRGEVAMLPNVTIAQTAVLSALDYGDGRDGIVMTDLDFPSVRYVYDGLAKRLGARIVVVPSDDGISIDARRVIDAIDSRTRLVAISHVLFRSAFIMDAAAICRRAREVGALVSLDAFHSVGVIPVDVKTLGVDFLSGGVLKWLCGGPGGSFLYVDPELRPKLEPSFTGWMAHANPFGFEPPPMRFRDDALRFALGTPPVPALYAAREGPKIIAEADMVEVRKKSLRQTQRIIDHCDRRGIELRTPREPERRGGSISMMIPHGREVALELNAEDIVCDFRPHNGVRFSPHFYTTDEEIDAAFDVVDDILRTERWKRQETRKTIVT